MEFSNIFNFIKSIKHKKIQTNSNKFIEKKIYFYPFK